MTGIRFARRLLPFLAGLLIVVIVWQPVAVSAFTPGDTSAGGVGTVATDSGAPISVTAGNTGDVTRGHGTLEFGATGDALGVNTDARVVFGDTSHPTERFAFAITNRDTRPRDIEIAYAGSNETESVAVTFRVYDHAGTRVAIVNDTTAPTLVRDVASSGTLFVIVVVDTNDIPAGTTLSGTLRISTRDSDDSNDGTDLSVMAP